MWWSSSNRYTNKTFLIIFFFFTTFILLTFIFYVNRDEQLFKFWKFNNKNLNQSLIQSAVNRIRKHFIQSSTNSTVSNSSSKYNQESPTTTTTTTLKTTNSTVICDKEKLRTFHEKAQQTTLTHEEKQILLETIALFTSELDKHHIDYITIGGSLLGIIRHGGLIPYDDDFDIAILEEDRSKVIEMMLKLNHPKLVYLNQYKHAKVFINIANCTKPGNYAYCVPYLDMFYMITSKTHWSFVDYYSSYAIKDIYPRKRAKFNEVSVWIPNNWQAFFNKDNVKKHCCTGNWLHMKEKSSKPSCVPCACLFPNLTLFLD